MIGLLEEMWWRYRTCPRTLEAAAQDFLERRNPEQVRAVLANPDSWYDFYRVDFKRRIARIYGLAGDFNVGTAGRWSAGWNRGLLAAAGSEPEGAAERILVRVCELAKARHDS